MKQIGFLFNIIEQALGKWRNFMARFHFSFRGISFIILFAFVFTFLYLNQKVSIYVAAYKLNSNYNSYEELSSKRDYLKYNYNKYVSVPRVNQWANQNNFSFGTGEKMIALSLRDKSKVSALGESKLASVFARVVNIPTGVSTALARNAD
jgi:hypothetical protein